jgi:hypothetical protein
MVSERVKIIVWQQYYRSQFERLLLGDGQVQHLE